MPKLAPLLMCAALAGPGLRAQTSEYPLAINLPTAGRMQFWDLGVAFTHRFATSAEGHGKDAYGLDGYAAAGVGITFGIKPVPGLNVILYRTADNKTFTFALQQQLMDNERFRLAFRAERFDEVITPVVRSWMDSQGRTESARSGNVGASLQLPMEYFITQDLIVSAVPTYISRTASGIVRDASGAPYEDSHSVFSVGLGLRVGITEKFGMLAEFYPRPARLSGRDFPDSSRGPGATATFRSGFAAGVTYRTFKHRFTLIGTNVSGTTANQVMAGDSPNGPGYGPSAVKNWALGFNIQRLF